MKDYKIMSITNGTTSFWGEVLIVKANVVNYLKGSNIVMPTFSSVIDSNTDIFFFDIDGAIVTDLTRIAQSGKYWNVDMNLFEIDKFKDEAAGNLREVYIAKSLNEKRGVHTYFSPTSARYRNVKKRFLRDFMNEESCDVDFLKSNEDTVIAKLSTGKQIALDYQSSSYIAKNGIGTITEYFVLDVPCITTDDKKCFITKKEPFPMLFDMRVCKEISQLSMYGCTSKQYYIGEMVQYFGTASIEDYYSNGTRRFKLSFQLFTLILLQGDTLQNTTIEKIRTNLTDCYIWEDYNTHKLYLSYIELPF